MANQIKEDLIEKEKMNKKMEDAKKSELLERIAGGVAHDFNNILQVIHNCNDMIDYYHEYPEKISKYTHLSSRATRFGQEIAQDILIYSKEKKLEKSPLNLSEAISNTIELAKTNKLKNIDLIFENKSQVLTDISKEVILIDDEEDITSAMELILRRRGINIVSFNCPTKAKDYVLNHKNDISVIITDHHMSEIKGTELIEVLRNQGIDIPIILASGNNINTKEIFNAEHLPKPYSTDELMNKIKKAA